MVGNLNKSNIASIGQLRPCDVNKKGDEIIIIQRLKQLGKSSLHQNPPTDEKKLLRNFEKQPRNKPFLPDSLVMVDAPLSRVVKERSWQAKRISNLSIIKMLNE